MPAPIPMGTLIAPAIASRIRVPTMPLAKPVCGSSGEPGSLVKKSMLRAGTPCIATHDRSNTNGTTATTMDRVASPSMTRLTSRRVWRRPSAICQELAVCFTTAMLNPPHALHTPSCPPYEPPCHDIENQRDGEEQQSDFNQGALVERGRCLRELVGDHARHRIARLEEIGFYLGAVTDDNGNGHSFTDCPAETQYQRAQNA